LNLFLDLDGTLLDSKKRLYKLFDFLVPESDLSYEDYWNLKRNAVGHVDILKDKFNYSDRSIEEFSNSGIY
jgi:phosphoglycolate phosphatase